MSKSIKRALSILLCAALLFSAALAGGEISLSSLPVKVSGTDALRSSIVSAGPEGNVLANKSYLLSITAKNAVSAVKLVKQGGEEEVWETGATGVTVTDNNNGTATWSKKYTFSAGKYYYTAYAKTEESFESVGVDFTVNATTKTHTVTFNNFGLGTIFAYYNGGFKKTVTGKGKVTVADGEVITLVATPKTFDGYTYDFLYWCNQNNSRVIGDESPYYLEVVSDMNISSQFSPNSISEDSWNKFVVYMNQAGNTIKNFEVSATGEEGAYTYEPYDVPAGPVLQDHVFKGWSMTQEEIFASSKRTIVVTPVYEIAETYTVSIPEGDYETLGAGTYTCQENERALVNINASAENGAGRVFQYWLDCDTNEIVSYSRGYMFYAVKNTTLKPVYGDEPVAVQPVVRITAMKFGSARISIFSERSVPAAYHVIQTGIIATKTESIGSNDTSFVIGQVNTAKGIANSRSSDGFYSCFTKIEPGETVWGRAYLIYRDTAGEIHTVYSSIRSYTR